MGKTLIKKKVEWKGWYIVFVSAFMGCAISATFPQFSMTVSELSEQSNISVQVLLTSDTLKSVAIVISMLLSGYTYKRFGTKITFIFALLATVIPQFLLPYTTSVTVLMLLKFLQGLAAIVFPIFLLLIMDWIHESQTGLATAVFNGIFYGGGGIGGTFAGIIITQKGWTASYMSVGIVQLFIGIIWILTVKDKHLDPPALQSVSSISTKQILKLPKVWLLILSFFSTTFVLQAITVDIPIYSIYLGYNEIDTGRVMTAVTIGIITACLISGKTSDFFALKSSNKAKSRIYALMVGPVIIMISSIVLIIAHLNSFSVFFSAILFFSFGAAWGLGTFYSILPEMFQKNTLPIITGFSGGIGDLGMPIAPLIVGVLFGVNGLWNYGWAFCTVLAFISMISCFLLCRYNHSIMAD